MMLRKGDGGRTAAVAAAALTPDMSRKSRAIWLCTAVGSVVLLLLNFLLASRDYADYAETSLQC